MENSFLHESHLLQERETLSEQKRCFFQEKANFEKERKMFTEAAIRLGREVCKNKITIEVCFLVVCFLFFLLFLNLPVIDEGPLWS
jgi:hypothetical protein